MSMTKCSQFYSHFSVKFFMKTEILGFVLFYSFKAINTTNSGEISYFVVIYDAVVSSFQRN